VDLDAEKPRHLASGGMERQWASS